MKKWNILPKAKKDFIKKFPNYSDLILQLLWNRGISNANNIKYFLEADYDHDGNDPFLFSEMENSVKLLIYHIKNKNKITIYGDYDADGVSSSVLLLDVLRTLNVCVDFYIPNRVAEGYGLNKPALKKIIKKGTNLIITVDTGIRNKEEVEFIKKKGVDIIITDHHQGPQSKDDYPDCLIINPALEEEKYPFKKLAGVGVALKFMQALIDKSTLKLDIKKRLVEMLFDLAVLGTVADCVTLKGENRLIVKKGLEALRKTKRLGFVDLMKVAQIKNIDLLETWNIGFQIAPRINAAGRMNHANTAFALLSSKNKKETIKLAEELNYNNQMRQKSTEFIFKNVEEQLRKKTKEALLSAVYEYRAGEEEKPWNEGIIGLVAGKVTEKYYRPCLIITKTKNGYKGSGRSILEFNIIKALEQSKDYLLKFGGHPMACGFSLKKENLDKFLNSMKNLAKKAFNNKNLMPRINIDSILDFSQINIDLADKISIFKPYGQDNPQPIFLSKNIYVLDKLNMGIDNQHIKLRLKNHSSNIITAIGFGQYEKWSFVNVGDIIDIVYYLDINEFNGCKKVQLKIIDIKNSQKTKN